MTSKPSSRSTAANRRPKRSALLALGMHRSGTSALSGMLQALGCDGPATPMKPDNTNPKGFFESVLLYKLHDEILASAGSSWHDYRPFPEVWVQSPKGDEYRDRLRTVIESEYGMSHLFVVKDPRLCRLLPFWIEVLEDMGIQPLVVHTHRNPREVAASLHARNGFDPAYGSLLWLRHVLDAEAASRDLPRVFTSYDKLLADWQGVAARMGTGLGIVWPRFSPANATELQSFISPELQHQRLPAGQVLHDHLTSAWIRDTFATLEGWADGDDKPADQARLDDIRRAFDASTMVFGSLVHREGEALVTERDGARARVKSTEAQLAERAKALEAAEAALAEKTKAIEALTAERDGARARVKGTEAQVAERAKALAAAEAVLAEKAKAIEALTAERDGARARVKGTEAQVAERAKALEAAEAALAARAETLDVVTAERDAARAEVAKAEAVLAARAKELDALAAERDAARASVQSDLTELQSALAQRRAEIDDGRAELAAMTATAQEAEARRKELEDDLRRQVDKVATHVQAALRRDADLAKLSVMVVAHQRTAENAQERQRALEAEAAQRMAELAGQKTDLDATRKSLAATNGRLQEVAAESQERAALITRLIKDRDRLRTDLEGAEAIQAPQKGDLDAARQALTEVQERQRALKAEAAQRMADIAARSAEADEAQTELAIARKALFEVETWRKELETQLTDQSAQAAQRAAERAARSAEADEAQTELAIARKSLFEVETWRKKLETQLTDQSARYVADLAAQNARLAEVDAYKTSLINSTSWRLTGPLRWLGMRLLPKYRNRP